MLQLFFFLLCVTAHYANTQSPNVIVAFADDMGYGDPSFNGGWIDTPCLNDIASNGKLLTQFYSQAPVCSPTRASVMTGQHPNRQNIYKANRGSMPQNVDLMSKRFQKHGYYTGIFGKWHVGTLTAARSDSKRGGVGAYDVYAPPQKYGYDRMLVSETAVPTWCPMRKSGSSATSVSDEFDTNFFGTRYWRKSTDPVSLECNMEPISTVPCEDSSKILVAESISFINEAESLNKPFFIHLAFHSPHTPVVDPADPYNQGSYQKIGAYQRTIQDLDAEICNLRTHLQNIGKWDNTIFMFFSDNGPERGPGSSGGLRDRKRSLHEGGVRVPCIVSWPDNILPNQQSSFPSVTTDIFPSLAQLLWNESVEKTDGIDASEILFGNRVDRCRNRPLFFWYNARGKDTSTINTGDYKLYRSTTESIPVQLYDLINDPSETNDILQNPPPLLNIDALNKDLNEFYRAVGADDNFIPNDNDLFSHGYLDCSLATTSSECDSVRCEWSGGTCIYKNCTKEFFTAPSPSPMPTSSTPNPSPTTWPLPISSNLILWLDANDESSFIKDENGFISQWLDKSGNDNSMLQYTTSKQPVYVSDGSILSPHVLFSASQFLESTGVLISGITDRTFFFVLESHTDSTQSHFFRLTDINNPGVRYEFSSEPALHIARGSKLWTNNVMIPSVLTFSNGGSTNVGDTIGRQNGADMTVQKVNPLEMMTSSIGTSAVGADWEETRLWDGKLSELLCYDRALSLAEIQATEQYLMNKWNIS